MRNIIQCPTQLDKILFRSAYRPYFYGEDHMERMQHHFHNVITRVARTYGVAGAALSGTGYEVVKAGDAAGIALETIGVLSLGIAGYAAKKLFVDLGRVRRR